ncbi:cell wall-binding repeat-containing protein [Georgenia sp. SYP-B2076]|uniref:cell wall-binding repeat-containing protein n=1 Tax=Georgenia sp. SYP-B2076 TaxID=2495881 RepID=UPI0013DEA446|nr:cell wall-binding repeat-containing protein [Georgenia sp. SYP-B2076]
MSIPMVATAATDENPSFKLIASDLEFMLEQIQIAESHAAGNPLLCADSSDASGRCVRDPMLPHGLRTVDGTFNNLEFDSTAGAADQTFPRLLPVEWRQAGPAPAGAPPQAAGATDVCDDPASTCYLQTDGFVYDTDPRVISNLIVDQTTSNPAAVAAAKSHAGSATDPVTGDIFIPNTAPDEGLSAPFNAWFTFFGQFFDHGLDLVNKGGNGTIVVPLQEDDPLWDVTPPNMRFMTLTRATNFSEEPGPDGVLGTPDDVRQHNNQTTPFVDQNQTYTSHPSHQVFLREYELVDGRPADTGRLLNGADVDGDGLGDGLATWNDVKEQASTVLGINLVDTDVLNVPQLVTDPYGNFVPGPGGFPLLVTDNNGAALNVEGSLAGGGISTANALRTDHAFLDDIAHGAVPGSLAGYDNVHLGEHFITGDGRGNENIGLSAVHHVFHSEHNRLAAHVNDILTQPGNEDLLAAYQDQSEEDDWSFTQRVFQAARFTNEMQYQHLVFEEFARKIQPNIDAIVFNENSYDSTIDPAITAEYAHVVYRFGHSMLTEELNREGFGAEAASLLDGFLNPVAFHCRVKPTPTNTCAPGDVLTPDQAAGSIINGTTNQVGGQIDELVVDTLRNNLLGLPLDLATINLVRGRDVGIPPLQTARKTFFEASGNPMLEPYSSWADFGLNLKNGENFGRGGSTASLVNFVAAYGKHPSILSETTVAGKRAAADLLVNGASTIEPLTRIFGSDRFATAAAVSASQFQPGVPVVFIADGANFPDALAAGPAAAAAGGPVLLATQNGIPPATAFELGRLNPGRIVVLGGTGTISDQVLRQLGSFTAGGATRLSGSDRYATAAAISAATFAPNAPVVYVASGENFPDALAVGAVAARDGAPLLLTRPGALPSSIANELTRLNPGRIVVLGGTGSVSASTFNTLKGYTAGPVSRMEGSDRFATSAVVSAASFPNGADTVYVATGTNFPDALATIPVAGLQKAPILLLPAGTSVPTAVRTELERLAPSRIVVLGGETVITPQQTAALGALVTTAQAPDDRIAFMNSTPGSAWASNAEGATTTGLESVDFWIGGLAEVLDPFGGMLGSTFNFVFEQQLENLQFGDRFYYLFRNQGTQLFSALEANSFSSLIQRNSDASLLPADIFSVQDPFIDLENLPDPLPAGLLKMPDGTWRWDGDQHIEIHGNRTAADRIRGGQGDDALWGYGGNDRIEGGSGNDNLLGGPGNDILTDTFGDDNIKGQDGNDAIDAGPGLDLSLGGHGDDFIAGSAEAKTVHAGTGDDVVLGGAGRDTVFGNEGADWIETGDHSDLLLADNSNQFQADLHGGPDVLLGGGGSDDYDAEGGDDVMVGQLGGTDRYHGMFGFDYVTYYGDNRGVDADLNFNIRQAPDVTAIRDRYTQVEALSGAGGDDVLRGVGIAADEFADTSVNKLTEEGLDRIIGLEDILRPAGATSDYAQRFMADEGATDGAGVANLILGGSGSDVIEGRFGDDFIDGDSYLRVQLEYDGTRYNSARDLRARVFSGAIDPGDITSVREIAVDRNQGAVRDTAVYAQDRSAYELTELAGGYWSVRDNGAGPEGTDILRNIEMLQFADSCLDLGTGLECNLAGAVTFGGQSEPPTEGQPLTATVTFDPAVVKNPTDIRFTWQTGQISEAGEEWTASATGDTLPDTTNGRVDTFTPSGADASANLRVVVSFQDDEGQLRTITSAPLGTGVAVNESPSQPVLSPAEPRVGEEVVAAPFTDADGLVNATASGILHEWQASADGVNWDVIAEAAGSPGYRVTEAEVGLMIRARVTYTDDEGTAEEVYSTVTKPVQPALVTEPVQPVLPEPEPAQPVLVPEP